MKTYKNLFPKIVSFENLLLAAKRAGKGKQQQNYVLQFNYNLEENLCMLQRQLINQIYKPGNYNSFFIYDPKKRMISAAPFVDRVVHHALCNIIEPIFERSFIHNSYANRKGKGTHKAIHRFQKYMCQYKYVLKCDIKKYFPSIDHEILKQEIRYKIADNQTLWLIDLIIDYSNRQEMVVEYFPGDDLLTPSERKKGLPIGNLTSQFFANVYLSRFDHFMIEKSGCPDYIRYVDDFAAFSDDKQELKEVLYKQIEYLSILRLKLNKPKCHIHRTNSGIIFLGQKVFKTHRLLKKQNVKRFCKRASYFENHEILTEQFQQSTAGWLGHAKQADTFNLRKQLIRKFATLEPYLLK